MALNEPTQLVFVQADIPNTDSHLHAGSCDSM